MSLDGDVAIIIHAVIKFELAGDHDDLLDGLFDVALSIVLIAFKVDLVEDLPDMLQIGIGTCCL